MKVLSNFGERLNEVMLDKGITALELAKQTEIGYNSITRYLQGVRLPTFSKFVKLINFFNCSADFLLGVSDLPNYDTTYLPIASFEVCFKQALTKTKISQYALQKATGISWANFHFWLTGEREPYTDSLTKLAQALDCSVDYLLGRVN